MAGDTQLVRDRDADCVRSAVFTAGQSERSTVVRHRRVAYMSVLFAAVVAFALPRSVEAQDTGQDSVSAVRVAVWAQGAYQFTLGRLAKNAASDVPSLSELETVSELMASPLVGAGVEIFLPSKNLGFRLGWKTTIGAEASGQVALCSLLEGDLCKTETAPVTVQGVGADLRLVQGSADNLVRPVVSLGLELRWYSFEPPECTNPRTDARLVCQTIVDLFKDPRTHSVLRAGVGVQAGTFPFRLESGLHGGIARYSGGTERTGGNWHQDLRLYASLSYFIL